MKNEIIAIDLFCGAGGFFTGLKQACNELDIDLRAAAINHWDTAVETHDRNHPETIQYHCKVQQIHPPDVLDDLSRENEDLEKADLLIAGPECTHFSTARGGKPVNEQKRMSPWMVLDWLEKLDVEMFLIENVGEIQDWGPIEDGEPTRDGSVFDAWINALNKLGYSVDWKVLNAADYGDPTNRKRFFLAGKQNGEATFPEPTHSNENPDLPNRRTARECIDWSDPGKSIWTRDLGDGRITPPKNSTMKRIAQGLRDNCSTELDRFADVLETLGRDDIQELREDRVIPEYLAGDIAQELDSPFLVKTTRPTNTELLLIKYWGKNPSKPIEKDLDTGKHTLSNGETTHLNTIDEPSLIMPKNYPYRGLHSNSLYQAKNQPLHTVTSDPRAKLVSPSLIRYSHGGATLSLDKPMPTIATERGGVFSLSNPYLTPLYNGRKGQKPRTRKIDRPLMTVTASKSPAGVVSPTLLRYRDISQYLDSTLQRVIHGSRDSGILRNQWVMDLTRRDGVTLCIPDMYPVGLDIRYRMLQPGELMQAQGFPESYGIAGTKTDRIEQIGNAVPVNLARELCRHILLSQQPGLGVYGGGLARKNDVEIRSYEEVIK